MKSILIQLLILFSLSVNSQNYKWDWLKGGTLGLEVVQNLTDNNGNIYVVGTITSSNTVIGTSTFNAVGGQDGILIKYDSNGNVLWSTVISGSGAEAFTGLSFDTNGNLYLTGFTTGTLVSVGSSTFVNSSAFSFPDYAPFISKFDINGNVISLKFIGHSSYLSSFFLKINVGANSVIISGLSLINSTLTIGSNTLNSQNVDFFIASFDLNANFNWVKFYSSSGYEGITDLTVQKNDDIYFAGITSSQSLIIATNTLSSPNNTTNIGFLCRMSPTGNIKWFKTFANANVPNIKLAALNTNAIFLALNFSSASLSIGSNTYSSQNYDCLVAKIDSIGNYQWSNLIRDYNGADIRSIATNQNNYLYVLCRSSSSVIVTSNYSITNSNTVSNFYFAAFDAKGKDWGLLMSIRSNSASLNGIIPYSISMDGNNSCYIVGRNNSDLVCGTYSISNTPQAQAFMAKIKLLNGVGVQESTFIKDELTIYPNPTAAKLNFNTRTAKFANINIADALGKVVCQKQNADLNESLDVSFLNPGIYFVKIQGPLLQEVFKMVKE